VYPLCAITAIIFVSVTKYAHCAHLCTYIVVSWQPRSGRYYLFDGSNSSFTWDVFVYRGLSIYMSVVSSYFVNSQLCIISICDRLKALSMLEGDHFMISDSCNLFTLCLDTHAHRKTHTHTQIERERVLACVCECVNVVDTYKHA